MRQKERMRQEIKRDDEYMNRYESALCQAASSVC